MRRIYFDGPITKAAFSETSCTRPFAAGHRQSHHHLYWMGVSAVQVNPEEIGGLLYYSKLKKRKYLHSIKMEIRKWELPDGDPILKALVARLKEHTKSEARKAANAETGYLVPATKDKLVARKIGVSKLTKKEIAPLLVTYN
jgi:hypothetical protein